MNIADFTNVSINPGSIHGIEVHHVSSKCHRTGKQIDINDSQEATENLFHN